MKTSFRSFGLRAIAAIIAAVLFGACGREASTENAETAQPASSNAASTALCGIFSPADAEAALGGSFQQTKRTAYGSVEECTFEASESAARPMVLTIRVEGIGNADATYKSMRELFSEDEVTIGGHRALISGSSQTLIITQDKKVLVSVGMPGLPPAQRRENLLKVAEAVVARL